MTVRESELNSPYTMFFGQQIPKAFENLPFRFFKQSFLGNLELSPPFIFVFRLNSVFDYWFKSEIESFKPPLTSKLKKLCSPFLLVCALVNWLVRHKNG